MELGRVSSSPRKRRRRGDDGHGAGRTQRVRRRWGGAAGVDGHADRTGTRRGLRLATHARRRLTRRPPRTSAPPLTSGAPRRGGLGRAVRESNGAVAGQLDERGAPPPPRAWRVVDSRSMGRPLERSRGPRVREEW